MDSEYDVFRSSIDLKRKLLVQGKEPEEDFVFISQNPTIEMPDAIDKNKNDKALELPNSRTSAVDCDNDSYNNETELNKYIKLLNQNSKKYLDHVYGVYKKQNTLMIGDSPLHLESYQARVKETSYPLTKGLLELLFKKRPNIKVISHADLTNYRLILETSNAHKKHFNKDESLRRQKSHKYKCLIAPMFENQLSSSEKRNLNHTLDTKDECPRELKKVCRNKQRNSPLIAKNQFNKKQYNNWHNNFKREVDSDNEDVSATDCSTTETDDESGESDEETAKTQLEENKKKRIIKLSFDHKIEHPRQLKKICRNKERNSASITKNEFCKKEYGNYVKQEIDSEDEDVNSIDRSTIEMDEESDEFDEEGDECSDYKNTTVSYEEIDGKSINYTTWEDPNELVDQLRYLINRQSENNCTCHEYEIRLILNELRKKGYIY